MRLDDRIRPRNAVFVDYTGASKALDLGQPFPAYVHRLFLSQAALSDESQLRERFRLSHDFNGIRRNESPDGLLFPASIVIVGDELFVTNLALPLTPTAGDEPEEDVSRYTISRIRARIPGREHDD